MELHIERARIRASIFVPLIFLFIAYIIKILEVTLGFSAAVYGIVPLQTEGLPGIVLSALIHGDFAHLYANTLPLLLLGTALFYYYRDYGLPIFLLIWVTSGALTWLFARSGTHVGASSLVYGLASFQLISAILRRNKHLLGFAFVIVFLYGGLLWGIFPAFDLKGEISWEGHLMGMVSGTAYALMFRKAELPWIDEAEDEEEHEEEEDVDDEFRFDR